MKKLLLLIVLFSTIQLGFAQFGISAGYSSGKAKVSGEGITVSSDEASGSFGVGVFLDLEIGDNLDFQPVISYAIGEKIEGESNNAIGFGGNLDYYIGGRENSIFLRGGIGIGVALADVDTDLVKKSATSANFGVGFDLGENIALIGSYGTQISNSSNIDGIDLKANAVAISLQAATAQGCVATPLKRPKRSRSSCSTRFASADP